VKAVFFEGFCSGREAQGRDQGFARPFRHLRPSKAGSWLAGHGLHPSDKASPFAALAKEQGRPTCSELGRRSAAAGWGARQTPARAGQAGVSRGRRGRGRAGPRVPAGVHHLAPSRGRPTDAPRAGRRRDARYARGAFTISRGAPPGPALPGASEGNKWRGPVDGEAPTKARGTEHQIVRLLGLLGGGARLRARAFPRARRSPNTKAGRRGWLRPGPDHVGPAAHWNQPRRAKKCPSRCVGRRGRCRGPAPNGGP